MSSQKLTPATIAAIKPADREIYIWDQDLKGFGLRIYPSGKKSFVLRTWSNHRRKPQRLQTLGSAAIISLTDARALAKRTLRNALTEPEPEPQDFSISFLELNKRYMRDYAKLHKRSWQADEIRSRKYLIPTFAERPIASITRADIAQLHAAIGSRYPYQANRVKEQLAKMFSLAQVWLLLPETHLNPTRSIPDFPERKKHRWLKAPEVTRLSLALQHEDNPYVVAFVYLSLLTSLRKNELLHLKWQNIFDAQAEITERKNQAPLLVSLPKEAMAILALLPRQKDNPYVFAGEKTGKPIADMKSQWRRIRKRADLPDVRIHDLRHTVGAWLAQSGYSLHQIGKVLGHRSHEATAVYSHLTDQGTQSALAAHALSISQHFACLPDSFPIYAKTCFET